MNDNLVALFRSTNLDLRKSRNGRYMDQKVTPDNLSLICDSIRNFIGSDVAKSFTVRDIWDSEYFRQTVMDVYSKPDPKTEAKSEYGKLIGQPIKTLAYAGVLTEVKSGRSFVYSVAYADTLSFVALNQVNALKFLDTYLTKVLTDSGEMHFFDAYQQKYHNNTLENEDFVELRDRYVRFIRGNTEINGLYEPRRIFNKVINILAVPRRIPGSKKGRLSEYPFIYKDLEYNDVNWRDLSKRKNLTRKQASLLHGAEKQLEKISDYEMSKAKSAIKKQHGLSSEVKDDLAGSAATQVHHIFPDSVFPSYRATLENLVLLTASQHNERAHPLNNTQVIDSEYQRVCLLAKLDSIEVSITKGDGLYSLKAFINMLNNLKGLNLPESSTVNVVREKLTHY